MQPGRPQRTFLGALRLGRDLDLGLRFSLLLLLHENLAVQELQLRGVPVNNNNNNNS